ncbi:MAG: Phenylacetic acid catabolic protein [Myxococcales bacterium]|nr:phenylacetate-CoA oxygenase subunit PaaI [Myxococcota bacterium]MDW8281481.1 Phenylacetic acid catabolic protein [Myxococcales bacterium]
MTSPPTYTDRAQMPPRYRDTVEQLMRSQAYRELAAARLFGHGLQFAEEHRYIKFMTWHIREEIDHYFAVANMYERFTGQSLQDWVQARLRERPIPFAGSWFELAMAQFLYDRGGFWQLQEYAECSFLPYRDIIGKIIEEERGHQGLGERIVIEACQSGRYEAEKQPLFERWLRLGLLSFGRPYTESNAYAISVGLKRRDSAEVMRDFIADIRPTVVACGLRFPHPAALQMELPPDLELTP